MRRPQIVWLALLCALLVFDGAPPGAPAAPAAREHIQGELREVQVLAYLARLNPDLGDRQRARIAAAVMRYSGKYQLDPALVLAVIAQESRGRPWARSEKGAVGLMQVMPHMMGVVPVAGNLTEVESNIEAGCLILSDNIRRLGEDRGILAYFWGNEVRGSAYLEQVQAARRAIRRQAAAS